MIERDVFHIRLKNIELQAERLIDPYLKTRPIAIISSSHKNGSILCLSDEAKEEGDEDMCWELLMSMYGTRDAALNWHETYARHLKEIGFRQCFNNPCLFYHQSRSLRTLVHGDDYVTCGKRSDCN